MQFSARCCRKCEHDDNTSLDPSFAEHRRNAQNILCDLSKHLMAMKESEGRLNNDAKPVFLQVRDCCCLLYAVHYTCDGINHFCLVFVSRDSEIAWFQQLMRL
jgi:hypothetical protein